MSIEVRIPKEITEYKEKILFGLNIRQLLCFTLAIVIGVTSYYFLNKYFGPDFASYVVIIEVIPIFALGFFKKDGFNFEKYMGLVFRHKLGVSKRKYLTDLNVNKIVKGSVVKHNGVIKKEARSNRKKETKGSEACEIFFERTKAKSKAKSKAIKQQIKAARKEYKAAKRQAKKGVKKTKVA